MNLSAGFVKRPVMTTLVMLAIAFFGVLAYRSLPVSYLPEVEFPTIEVTVSYPGADPTTVANNVVTPLEQQFTTIEGIQSISSRSSTGSATILLQFVLSRSIDFAATDVLAAINAAEPQLPPDLPYAPTYTKANPTSLPILFYAITSETLTGAQLYDYAHNVIGEQLNIIEGVAQVQTYGAPYAVRIQVDPQKLAARDIGIDEFGRVIREANVYLPTGTLFGPKREYTVNCRGQMRKAEEYRSLIVKNDNGLFTRVSDVADAFDSLWNDKYYLNYTAGDISQLMVGLAIQKQPGANTLDIIQKINDKLPFVKDQIPGAVHIRPWFDESVYIKSSIIDVQVTLLIALALVVFVIFIYLGKLVNTIIPALAIPMSVLGTFIIMKFLGFTINILSLLALTLSIGFLVDDAIVVLENIARHAEHGEPRKTAALEGSRQISFTVLSMTITLCTIFIPLIFMEGIIGRLLHEFAVTIVTAVLISGMISLSFTPMLCSKFIASYQEDVKKTRVEILSEKLNNGLLNIYKPSLEWALNHRKTVLATAFFCLGSTLFLLITLPKDFLPEDDIGFVQGFCQGADGTSPYLTADNMKEVQKVVTKNPYCIGIVNMGAVQQDNEGMFFVSLIDVHERPSSDAVIKQLQVQMNKIPGFKVFMRAYPLINLQIGAASPKANYQYTLQSLDSEALYKAGKAIETKLKKLPELTSVTSDMEINQPQLQIDINRDKASIYGITALNIENTLSLAFADINLSPINEPDDQYYVIMEVLPKFYRDPSMLSQLWLRSTQGGLVALSEVVTMTEGTGPLTVNHLNGLPSATIAFDLNNVPLGTALLAIEKEAKTSIPSNVSGRIEGAANIFKQSFASLNFLLMITIFVIYIILGILYENFFHPITVMSTLPPAALGGLLALLLFNYSLSLYAFVGIIMLLGIVMKNGIIMVDFANEAVMKEGKSPHDAIYAACTIRLRPILMTTFAALMGAVPIASGIGGVTAEGRRPLGVVIVVGLLFSQILTLYLTPVTYLYIEKLRTYLHKKTT
ncbi:MAG: Multidrug resistance protein MdtC [Chlamydiae bacterium]|nr:Multidrug resistance protein MdtC [Chlamydiota bacterium]